MRQKWKLYHKENIDRFTVSFPGQSVDESLPSYIKLSAKSEKGYFRITPGTDEENKRCIEVMKKIFSKKKGE